jgi:diguanylate cyclase (GGDEF)-like protein
MTFKPSAPTHSLLTESARLPLPPWANASFDSDSNRHFGTIRNRLMHLVDRRTPETDRTAEWSAIWEDVADLALRDELTGLYNRRGVFCLGEALLAHASLTGQRLLVNCVDVDGLKRVSDRGGHAAGDRLLVTAAEVLRRCFRGIDLIGRTGGDEFVAIAAAGDADLEGCLHRRLQDLCEQANDTGRQWPLSLTVGSVWYDPRIPQPLSELIDSADRLLHEQRRKRRTPRVVAMAAPTCGE